MRIKKLILKSFGKFQNTSFDLMQDINLIIGENESGKSTIHKFIEGMFYGFYKPNIKNKKTTESYDKYLPWDNANDFSGVMIIEDADKEIRIERSFMKGKDYVEIYDNLTGEKITNSYPYDSVTRTHQPGLFHLKMNLSTYSNTISITQMQSKTTDELIMEIKDNVINLGETKRVDISLTNVLKTIATKKAIIGTERSKKSNLGKTKETITLMETEKEDSGKVWEEIKQLRFTEEELKAKLETLNQAKKEIEKKMNYLRLNEDKETFQKVLAIKSKLKDIENEMNELSPFMALTKEEINESILKLNQIEFLEREYEQQKDKINELTVSIGKYEKEIKDIDSIIVEIGASEKISRDVYKFEEFENSRKYAQQPYEGEPIEKLKRDLEQVKKSKKGYGLLGAVSMIFAIITLFLLVYKYVLYRFIKFSQLIDVLNHYNFLVIAVEIVLLILLILAVLGKRKKDVLLSDITIKLKQALENEIVSVNRIKDIEEKQQQLLGKYECNDLESLQFLRDKYIKDELLFQENYKRARQLEEEMGLLLGRLKSEREKHVKQRDIINEYNDAIEAVMRHFDVFDEDGLKHVLSKQERFVILENEKESKNVLLKEVTKGKSYLDIAQLNELDDYVEGVLTSELTDDLKVMESYEELEGSLKMINEKIIDDNKAMGIIITDIISKENRIKKPALIEEELRKNYEEYESMTYKLNVLDIVEEAILTISKSIQSNFAPTLNEKISSIIAIATDYKYTEIKVDSEMGISVLDQEVNKLVNVADLSAGTVDLIYFALRLSIAQIMSPNQKMPIILDDSFVQYDEHRLVKVLEILSRMERQVILLSCHKRELKVLKRIREDLHVVNI